MTKDVQAAANGDRAAFERLVRSHAGAVAAVTLAVTGDPGTAQEAAQEAFLHAWRGLPTLEDPGAFGGWLRQIAKNRALDVARASRRAEDRAAGVDPDGLSGAADGAEARLLAAEDDRRVREALAELPEASRAVLILYYREETPTAELAARLGLSEAAARQRLHRAREQLRARLDAGLGDALRRTAPAGAFVLAVLAALPRQAEAAPAAPRARGWAPWLAAMGLLACVVGAGWWRWSVRGPEPSARPVAPGGIGAGFGSASPPPDPLAPEPSGAPVEEAYAALAAAVGGHLVHCPGPRLPGGGPLESRLSHLRWENGENWFVADEPSGTHTLRPRIRFVDHEFEDGQVGILVQSDPSERPLVVRWDAGRCSVHEPRPVSFSVRLAPGQTVRVGGSSCRESESQPGDDPSLLRATGEEGSICTLMDDRMFEVTDECWVKDGSMHCPPAHDSWERSVVVREGATFELLAVDPPPVARGTWGDQDSLLSSVDDASGTLDVAVLTAGVAEAAIALTFDPDGSFERALSDPDLGAAARDLLFAWQEADVREQEAQAADAARAKAAAAAPDAP